MKTWGHFTLTIYFTLSYTFYTYNLFYSFLYILHLQFILLFQYIYISISPFVFCFMCCSPCIEMQGNFLQQNNRVNSKTVKY
jgi:hypothetical protein